MQRTLQRKIKAPKRSGLVEFQNRTMQTVSESTALAGCKTWKNMWPEVFALHFLSYTLKSSQQELENNIVYGHYESHKRFRRNINKA